MYNENSKLFNEIYESFDDFNTDLNKFGFDFSSFDEKCLKLLFVMLIARYGDREILGYQNVYRWKMRLQYTIYTYGIEWYTKLKIQDELNNLTEDDLKRSNVTIQNVADNPATTPDTTTIEELNYINKQVTNATKRDKLSILLIKYRSLGSYANEEFLRKFEPLFSRFITGDKPIYFYQNKKHKH